MLTICEEILIIHRLLLKNMTFYIKTAEVFEVTISINLMNANNKQRF